MQGDRIPLDEWLYRSADPQHIIDGVVLVEAVEMPNCSFIREVDCEPEDALDAMSRPTQTEIICTRPDLLPEPLVRPGDKKKFEFVAVHLPDPEDDEPNHHGHSEVRLTRAGGTFSRNIRSNSAFMETAKAALATCMQVHQRPTA